MKSNKDSHLPENRRKLSRLIERGGDVIKVEEASRILDLSKSETAKKLSRWAKQGWLRRVAHGAYVAVNLDMLERETVVDDPWVLVPHLFAPAYVGGRTAAEYWDLTEQIFNDVVVVTSKLFRNKFSLYHGMRFILKHFKPEKMFGTQTVWRHSTKVQVSDVHKTIIDMLDDPVLGGGIRHVSDCLFKYLRRPDRDDEKLIDYAKKQGNGAIFKRLGFLIENESSVDQLIEECKKASTQGNAKLDPSMRCKRIVTRWRLRIPENWIMEGHS